MFMTLLDVSVTNVALPSIGDDTGAGASQLQWIVSGYTLAFGLVPVLGGKLGDDHGRRLMFQVGVAGFVVTSALSGLAPTAGFLIAARVLQGLFGGLINPQTSGLVQQMFSGADRGRAFGVLGTTVGLGTAVGPIVGGLLIALGGPTLGWRLVFFINIPVGLVVLALSRRFLPATTGTHPSPPRRARRRAPRRCDVLRPLRLRGVRRAARPPAGLAGGAHHRPGHPVRAPGAPTHPGRPRSTGRPPAVPSTVVRLRSHAGPRLLPGHGRTPAGAGPLLPARSGLHRSRVGARGDGVRRGKRGVRAAGGAGRDPDRATAGRGRCGHLRRRRRGAGGGGAARPRGPRHARPRGPAVRDGLRPGSGDHSEPDAVADGRRPADGQHRRRCAADRRSGSGWRSARP